LWLDRYNLQGAGFGALHPPYFFSTQKMPQSTEVIMTNKETADRLNHAMELITIAEFTPWN
jgi:hypothetical protein